MTDDVRTATTGFVFDPFAEGYTDDPYPRYDELRTIAPVHEHPLGFWILSRHADVTTLQRSVHSVDEQNLTRLPAWKDDPAAPVKANRPMLGLSMLDLDPPDHTRLRRLVAKAFTRRAIDRLESRVEGLVDAALDRVADAGRANLVAEIAFPLPFSVISELLGIPVISETARLRELTATLVRALEPLVGPEMQAEIRAANAELTTMVRELTAWKRNNPGDDLLTALITAEHEGDVLSEDELVAQVMLLYVAGHETAVNLLGSGLLALVQHPEQAQLLRSDPGIAGNAVDELLRYDTPVHLMRRITVEPMSFHGAEIPAGSLVLACLAAANRDRDFWGHDADELHLDRSGAGRHVSFGAGLHHCLGAPLVRMEGRIAFSRFVERFPSAVVTELRWNGRINLRGPALLSVDVG